MLTNQFDALQSKFMDFKHKLDELNADPTINKVGFLYKEKKAQIIRSMQDYSKKIKGLGSDIAIVTVTGKWYKENNLLHLITLQFSGISEQDALSIFKLRYPASFDHKAITHYTGKAKIEPLNIKTEFRGKTKTEGNY